VRHHRLALTTIGAAALLDVAGGLAFAAAEHISAGLGLYWAVATATTVGYGDIIPNSDPGRAIATMVMLTVIPLWSAAFSLFTSALTSGNVTASEARMKAHIEDRLKHHLGGPHDPQA
jgi:voltage-gated potassium channel